MLWSFSPNVIAHASLFTSDVPAAALILAATYAFWRWLPRPSVAGAVIWVARLFDGESVP